MKKNSFIDYLKTLPDNSGQLVDLKHSNGIIRCFFMWFYNDNKIDLRPIDSMSIISVDSINFNKITKI